jgi:hypothetical protein
LAITDSGQSLGLAQQNGQNRYFLRSAAGVLEFFDTPGFTGGLVDLANDGTMLGVQPVPTVFDPSSRIVLIRRGSAPVGVDSCSGSRGGFVTTAMNDRYELTVDCLTVNAGFFRVLYRYVTYENGERLQFLGGSPTWWVQSLVGINASGQVLGTGTMVGDGIGTRPLLLTPCIATPVSTATIRIPGQGGTGSFRIAAQPGCRANVVAPSWLNLTEPGAGDTVLSYSVGPNYFSYPQQGTIRVGGATVQVVQEGSTLAPCTYRLSATRTQFAAGGGTGYFDISTRSDCSWTLESVPDWISLGAAAVGSGTRGIPFTIAPNGSGSARSDSILLAGQSVVVRQLGSGDCSVWASVERLEANTSGSFDLVANAGCAWSITSPVSWLRLQKGYSGTESSTVSGSGSQLIVLSLDANPFAYSRTAQILLGGSTVAVVQPGTAGSGYRFHSLDPCRIADTRQEGNKTGPFGPPRMATQTMRVFPLRAAGCGVPLAAKAVSLNITIVPLGEYVGFVTVWPAGQARPLASTLNAWNGRTVANAAVVSVNSDGAIAVYVSNATDVVIDVNGYFTDPEASNGLVFYPVTPCRVADTRAGGGKSGDYGPPAIPVGGGTRTFPMAAAGCGIPVTAQAVSLNVTAVPHGYLAYVTAWPAGQARALASTLNSWDGQVVPNAAIVPLGASGGVSLYSPNATDLVIDVNGYFGPPGIAAGGLHYYPLAPCRFMDTRVGQGNGGIFGPPQLPANSMRAIVIPAGGCGAPADAKAYVMNATAVPPGYLGYLTIWPTALPQPMVSTLNSWNGQVVANAAIVPAGAGAAVSFYTSDATDLVVDLNGFFLP